MAVLVETSLGTIVFDLYCEEKPRTCMNFIKLCKMKHFNFCLFHCVQKNLVAQSGDPSGTGRGGWSFFRYLYGEQAKFFDAEKKPKISHSRKDDLNYLDDKHTVFGYVAEGIDFIHKINEVYCDKDGRPFRNVRIHHTFVLDDPFVDIKRIDYPSSPALMNISADEELDNTEELSPTRLEELKAEEEIKTHTQLLTLIGDLPNADVKPPNNVLFVCKLNPVTTSEDLEIIFSRFGEIKSCEVIRDKRTNASLQYAFIEFEKEADCEDAYFKMDKVVIDDRRIHVDFSQSVDKFVPGQHKIVPKHSESGDGHTDKRKHIRQNSHSYEHKKKINSPKRRCSPPLLGEGYDLVISEESDSSSSSCSQRKSKKTHSKPFLTI
ncbi:unnamed protein product [Trichobilharzia regenti]|nr:unnamed protein product [Trichobilharzia regenti]